mgnify:CR=1 FL=1
MIGVAQIEPIYNDFIFYGYPFMGMPSNNDLLTYLNPKHTGKKISNLGWYFSCNDSKLYSDIPQNYREKKTKLKFIKNEIQIIMNLKEKTLKFIVESEDKGVSYENIPIDIPLVPAVLLLDENDSVEIIPC